MSGKTISVKLSFEVGQDVDIEEKESLTRQLRDELIDLDVEAVDYVSGGKVPARAKAGDPITWGALLLALAASGGVFTTLISAVQSWLTRNNQRSITLEIDGDRLELQGVSSQEQQRLTDAWLSRHVKGAV